MWTAHHRDQRPERLVATEHLISYQKRGRTDGDWHGLLDWRLSA